MTYNKREQIVALPSKICSYVLTNQIFITTTAY